ncbi:MAG: hypothetical protein QW372_03095 [Nitrososphaerales archaeon]
MSLCVATSIAYPNLSRVCTPTTSCSLTSCLLSNSFTVSGIEHTAINSKGAVLPSITTEFITASRSYSMSRK